MENEAFDALSQFAHRAERMVPPPLAEAGAEHRQNGAASDGLRRPNQTSMGFQ